MKHAFEAYNLKRERERILTEIKRSARNLLYFAAISITALVVIFAIT